MPSLCFRWLVLLGITAAIAGLIETGEAASPSRPGLQSYRTPSYLEWGDAGGRAVAGSTTVELSVFRTGDYREACTVRYVTQEGTARAGVDYAPSEGKLNFPAGQSLATLAIVVHGTGEAPKSFQVVLQAPSSNAVILSDSLELTLMPAQEIPASPRLRVERQAKGHGLVVKWPVTAEQYVLEQSTDCWGDDWHVVTALATQVGDEWQVSPGSNAPSGFFRLRPN